MKRSSPIVAAGLIGAAFLLSGYSGGGRVSNSPPVIAYACEGGRQAAAIYEHGNDYFHAKVLLTFDGRTTELEAAPTLYGIRYVGEPSGEQPRALMWSLRGERAWLSEATEPHDVTSQGQPIAQCTRVRGTLASAEAGHSADSH